MSVESVLREAAEELSNEFVRPDPSSSHGLVEKGMIGDYSVFVSNVRYPSGAGNNMHEGTWVIVTYDDRMGFQVSFKRDGVSGNPDKSTSLSDPTADDIVEAVHEYSHRL